MKRPLQLLIAAVASVAATIVFPANASESRVVKITGSDSLQYSVKKIEAAPGEKIKIVLTVVSTMSRAEMAHNWILLAEGGGVDAFVMAAAMARTTDYIPKDSKGKILAQTSLAGGGETVEVEFTAPKEPGEYTYLCTFPGHYVGGMKGVLIVK